MQSCHITKHEGKSKILHSDRCVLLSCICYDCLVIDLNWCLISYLLFLSFFSSCVFTACFKRNYKIELRGNAEHYFRWVADRIYRVNIRKLKKFIILCEFLCCKIACAFIWFVTWERLVMFAILCESYLHTKWCTVLDLNLLSDCMGHNLQISW